MKWSEMNVEQHNSEVASRLRGLAALVDSCDRKVRIKMSAKLVWTESNDEFTTGILSFPAFSDRLKHYTTERLIELLRSHGDDELVPLREHLEAILSGD